MFFRPNRRRSQRFAELVDEGEDRRNRHRRSRSHSHSHAELSTLAALTGAIGKLDAAPEPEPDFRTSLRAMLLATVDREGIGTRTDDPAARCEHAPGTQKATTVRPAATRARAAAVVGVMVGALALSGVSAASTSAVPGDPLYQVKRTAEQAQLTLAGSELSRGKLYFEFAYSRLQEASQVDDALVTDVLSDMNREITAGVVVLARAAAQGDAAAPPAITAFVAEQRARLEEFADSTKARSAAAGGSFGLLDDVDVRATALARTLTKGCRFQSADRLGPVPTC